MFKRLLSLLYVIPLISYADVSITPKIPSISQSNVSELKLKAKTSTKQVEKYGGYKVTDSQGNEFYVDDIKNPKHKVVINEINNKSKKSNVKVVSYVDIGKICFNLTCK